MKMNLDLNAPGAIDRLLAFHKSTFGEMRMETEALAPSTITVPVPAEPQAPAAPAGFDEEAFLRSPAVQNLLAQVRKEEKDKLYPQIDSLKNDLKSLTDAKSEEIRAAEEKARKDAEEAAAKRFEESSAKDLLREAQMTWEQKFEQIEKDRQAERALFQKEKSFLELSQFTQSAVSSALENNEIAPELAHMVTGNTVEEVTASLENVKATSAKIAESVAAALAQQAPPVRGVSATGYAPVGPMEQAAGTRTLSAQDISKMSMQDFAKLRGTLGIDRQSANRGLFG